MQTQTRNQRIQAHRFRSGDPSVVSAHIERMYARNEFVVHDVESRSLTSVAGFELDGVGVYLFECHVPFTICVSGARTGHLLVSGASGALAYSARHRARICSAGDVMPLPLFGDFSCIGGGGASGVAVTISTERVDRFVARWIGDDLAEPVSFAFEPLARDVGAQWNLAANCLQQMMKLRQFPGIAVESLIEHMIRLLVTGHRNNYTQMLDRPQYIEAQARAAIALIQSDPLGWRTLSAVALRLGCATAALDKGIRRLLDKGFSELHYDARLDGVHQALANGEGGGFVGTLRAFGFSISERFVLAYSRRFGEPPSSTYRKNPNAEGVATLVDRRDGGFSEGVINKFIDESIRKPISLADLARLVGMSEHATIAAFKFQFSRTPIQYVIERKLDRAGDMLRRGSESILAIALECGFGTQSYLTSKMKQHWGVTPGQVRAASKQGEVASLVRTGF